MAGVEDTLMALAPFAVLRRRKSGQERCVGWGLLSVVLCPPLHSCVELACV